MKKTFLLITLLLTTNLFGQRNLDYFINKAIKNDASLNELRNQLQINKLQKDLDYAQSSGFQIYLTGNYLFAPYFNNGGRIITTIPDPNAIGYDVGITNGGFYSAQVNVDKNIFNGALVDALSSQRMIFEETTNNNISLMKRELIKQITDQYLQTYLSFRLYKKSDELTSYLKEQMQILGKLVESGSANQSEFLLLSIEGENQKIAANDYYSQYKTNLLTLNSLCGIKDTNVVMIDSVSLRINKEVNGSTLFKKFELDSLSIQNQQQIFETKYQPQISIFFNTGLNAIELNNIQRKFGMSAGINFSLPVFDGNQSSLTWQQNQISSETLKSFKTNFATQLSNQRNSVVMRLENLRNTINNFSKQIESYKVIIKMSERELQQGQLSMIEYLTILKNYIELQKNNITTNINYQIEVNNYNYWNY